MEEKLLRISLLSLLLLNSLRSLLVEELLNLRC